MTRGFIRSAQEGEGREIEFMRILDMRYARHAAEVIIYHQSINQSKHISIAPYVASESEAHDDGN